MKFPIIQIAGVLTVFSACNAVDLLNAMKRQKRSQYFATMGHMNLDIKCAPGDEISTVCAPGGKDDCPHGYEDVPNVGQCGFSTLAWFIASKNIAGTCCMRSKVTEPEGNGEEPPPDMEEETGRKDPKVIVYAVPVHAGFPQLPYGGIGGSGSGPAPLYKIQASSGSLAHRTNSPGRDLIEKDLPEFSIEEVPYNQRNGPAMRNAPLLNQQSPIQERQAPEYAGGEGMKATYYPYPPLPQPVVVDGPYES